MQFWQSDNYPDWKPLNALFSVGVSHRKIISGAHPPTSVFCDMNMASVLITTQCKQEKSSKFYQFYKLL